MESYLASDQIPLKTILFTKIPLLAYASKDLIALVDASSLKLIATLAFWDAFPSTFGTETYVQHIDVDTVNKWIIASAGMRIAIWTLSSLEENTWRVHSTISAPKVVTALEGHDGRLWVGMPESLSLYSSKVVDESNSEACIWMASSGRLVQRIPHPRPLVHITWRSQPSKDEYILYTTTSDSALRIFLPVLDTPRHLQLHATVDPYCFLPSSLSSNRGSPVFPFDRDILRAVLGGVLRNQPGQRTSFDESQRRRLTEIYEESWDLFARILDDGSIVIHAVANLDRRPPTLLKQFTLLHSLFDPPLESLPTSLLVIPSASHLILITDPPVSSHNLLPLPFFDAKKDGLRTISTAPESGKFGHLPITRISRSPEGHAVAVMRRGAAEVWKVKRSGGLRLLQEFVTLTEARVLAFHSGRSVAVYEPTEHNLRVTMGPNDVHHLTLPRLLDLFLVPPNHDTITCLIGIAESLDIIQIHAHHPPNSSLTIHSSGPLPSKSKLAWIRPVDPMVWSSPGIDVLLSISQEGDLEFWAAESSTSWRKTGHVVTGRSNIERVRCSSSKKTVLVVKRSDGHEVSIWDSKESQFSSGLEQCEVFSSPVIDLDWTATPDGQAILAIGFEHHILLLFQQRMTYFEQESRWGVFGRIEIGNITRHPVADSIWISQGQILTGAGHQMIQARPGFTLRGKLEPKDLFETVARRNGPLPHYHPQMLLQCLLWEKISLVKQIVSNLAKEMKYLHPEERATYELPDLPIESFLERDSLGVSQQPVQQSKKPRSLFDDEQAQQAEDIAGFSTTDVSRLITDLEETPLQSLSDIENEQLLVLLQTTLDIDEQRRALDADGLRYLISMNVFYILNKRIAVPRHAPVRKNTSDQQRGLRERIRYRDIVWAFHSGSQDVLLAASTAACGGKMVWTDARALGIFLWLNSIDTVKSQFEVIARNQYMSGEDRDPSACCLFYFALGKIRLVQGLWKQAAWHPEQGIMLKFLSNDFEIPKWRTAALKNAFALLGKRRFEMAAAFFLLGGSLQDAVNVCIKQMNDFQLGVALARVVEGDSGPILTSILKSTVLPIAFKDGNRWLGSWAFWKLNRRDLSVRILVTPLKDFAGMLVNEGFIIPETGESNYDDPSLALLYSRLKSASLQTIKGSTMIPGQQEFDFVLQIARVFCRMGCHPLALYLVTDWSFDPPEPIDSWAFPKQRKNDSRKRSGSPGSPTLRRSMSRRRSVIDLDLNVESQVYDATTPKTGSFIHLPSLPETTELRLPSPVSEEAPTRGRTGFGSLMQAAKREQQVPEFDMGMFGM
ncbi:Regulator of V-ATPase in vacuolar membrane protein 1 AltName: Full=Suppression of the onset of impotence protein 3 [Serendipita indica DSM 11827]|nr:Regulator of V-ATPase in vacuolar membrane protein 1 AltName: Full=Suppression of the onset of impotence protein 3 [Serendipita indica DSM 11827]